MFTDVDLSDKQELSKEVTQPDGSNDKKSKKSFLYNHILLPFKKNPLTSTSIVLILLSTVLLFILLVGGRTRVIYLSKFDFQEPIKFITHKNDITFTLYGHCVDDQCTTPNMVHNFDKLPSASEITSSGGKKAKRFDVGGTIQGAGNTAQNAGNTISNTAQNAGGSISNTAQNAGGSISNTAQNAGNTISNSSTVQDAGNTLSNAGNTIGDAAQDGLNDAEDIAKKAPGLLAALLKEFENFKPKHPTTNFSGFISIPYLLAFIFNFFALVLLYFHFPTPATLFLLASALLNALALFFDLLVFVWVFELVALIPGVGKQHTGPGIILAGWSAFFLGIAALLLGGRLYYKLCCGGWSRDAYRGIKKMVGRGIKKMRKPKETDEEKQRRLMDSV